MRRKPLWIGAAIVVVAGVVTGMALRGRGDKTLEVHSAKVARQKIVQKVTATGTIQPRPRSRSART
jgi:hypothetical protein